MPDLKIISRPDAKAQGLKRYFTGKPCPHGHVVERKVSNRVCLECHRLCSRRYYARNSEEILEKKRTYYVDNSEEILEKKRTYYVENTQEILARHANWQKENPDKVNALAAKRRAAKRQATPPWSLYGYHRDRIDTFYADSALFRWAFGLPFEVDHIVSLFNGGLHVYWNLAHLIQSTNASKSTQDDNFVYPSPTFERITYRYNPGRVAL